jgi:hypothetical protein
MTYVQDLTMHLRLRAVDERVVSDIVAEVEEYQATGGDVEEFFGPPEQYAAQFPQGQQGHPGRVPVYVGAIAAVLWMAVSAALIATDTWQPSNIDAVLLLPPLAMLLTGVAIGFATAFVRATRPPTPHTPSREV